MYIHLHLCLYTVYTYNFFWLRSQNFQPILPDTYNMTNWTEKNDIFWFSSVKNRQKWILKIWIKPKKRGPWWADCKMNLPFVVVELPYISATDEQSIDHMYCHHSSLTFALLFQQCISQCISNNFHNDICQVIWMIMQGYHT